MLDNLAIPRIAAVQNFFKTTGDTDLLGCYAWSQAVSASLLPLMADLEVPLRNSLHVSLSQYYGGSDSFDWMMTSPPFKYKGSGPKPKRAAHSMASKTQENIATAVDKLSIKRKKPTPDDIVAAMPFGFWEQIINSLDHKSHPAGLQNSILSSVFPHAPDLHLYPYGSLAFKLRVVNLLSCIRDVRNRIGHHDAIWKTPEFDTNGARGFIPRSPRHTINSLRLLAERIAWFAGWVNPNINQYMRWSDHWMSYMILLNQEALAIYRTTGGGSGSYEKVLDAISLKKDKRSLRRITLSPRIEKLRMRLLCSKFHY